MHGRIKEGQWRLAMVRLRDSIVYCSNCGSENFYDAETTEVSRNETIACWSCKEQTRFPPRLDVGKNIVMLSYDTKLYPHHVDDSRLYDFSKPAAEVTQHPKDPNLWGLKNLSDEKWVTTPADGTVRDVEPGRSVPQAVGTRIHFGTAEGKIRI